MLPNYHIKSPFLPSFVITYLLSDSLPSLCPPFPAYYTFGCSKGRSKVWINLVSEVVLDLLSTHVSAGVYKFPHQHTQYQPRTSMVSRASPVRWLDVGHAILEVSLVEVGDLGGIVVCVHTSRDLARKPRYLWDTCLCCLLLTVCGLATFWFFVI